MKKREKLTDEKFVELETRLFELFLSYPKVEIPEVPEYLLERVRQNKRENQNKREKTSPVSENDTTLDDRI